MLTWIISFDRIREARLSATDMPSLMSFFDRQAIPEALLREYGGRHADFAQPVHEKAMAW